ncbi:sulfotransferase family protein [Parahaliea sp. F7430]|uniref:Sulfotransferase family protein n=1 Tax=Sediminihaliea albiluteola TaxID=2758564 RepID=A0A7W2TYI3_9GAMM|nr:sulfotransferase family protein [Sediminihaliea albiluteola]MBA6414285.1 sulfotransferase family protein [Sediminihaliea albiluteola]
MSMLGSEPVLQAPQRVLAILGMHRSGTSCLTGSLQDAGLELGDCHTWNPYNKKGNRENQAFVDLHDAILAANGGAWDKPPRKVRWQQEHYEWARNILAEQTMTGVFGFKDPRALLVIDGWRKVLPSLEFVGIFRHPEAVVQSLANRSQLARDHALALWFHYNRALWHLYKKERFPVLCFDEGEQEFQAKVASLTPQLGLTREEHVATFYDRSLKQYCGESLSTLPWRVRRLYQNLRKVSV